MTAIATREQPESGEQRNNDDEVFDDRRGYIRLGITITLIVFATIVLKIGGVMIVIGSILAMIMLHELGHFITARWAGMRVTDFFLGFGPTLWSVKKGDTRYGVKAIPAGGFVRVIGMNNLDPIDDPADEPFTYRSKSYWQRVRFAGAGSFMHFVIAFILMVILLAGVGRVLDSTPPTTQINAVAASVLEDGTPSPARAAGLRAGDKVLAINGTAISSWERVSSIIRSSADKELDFTIERDGRRFSLPVTPVNMPNADDEAQGLTSVGRIGIEPYTPVTREGLPIAMWHAAFEMKNITTETAGALVGMFSKSSLEKYSDQLGERGPADPATEGNRLLSPVGVARVADASAEAGVASVLSLLIAINVFVGIFNLIPLPPFDGGHIAVATYEAIRSRKGKRHTVDMAKLLPVAYAVILSLLLLSASALWLDIVHPFDLG